MSEKRLPFSSPLHQRHERAILSGNVAATRRHQNMQILHILLIMHKIAQNRGGRPGAADNAGG